MTYCDVLVTYSNRWNVDEILINIVYYNFIVQYVTNSHTPSLNHKIYSLEPRYNTKLPPHEAYNNTYPPT